ncbi:MAG TPA: hypothetical protein VLJ61_18010 [Pyrinomonadaceae bacterium]|nr:hypothetical protein [Pyrinomonadaceae bacterium]
MARMMLKRVGILSVAKWQTFLGLLSGLFAGVVYAGYYSVYYRTMSVGVISWYLLGTPIIYGGVAFLATLIGGAVYNSLAGTIGGMILEFDNPRDEYDAPPQPSEEFFKRPSP